MRYTHNCVGVTPGQCMCYISYCAGVPSGPGLYRIPGPEGTPAK